MGLPHTPRRALHFTLIAAVVASSASVISGGCGPDQNVIWLCLNPVTGKEDSTIYDPNHYVGGLFDPCHCYDPCGPLKSCPSLIDAGPQPPGCDAGAGSGGSDGGS